MLITDFMAAFRQGKELARAETWKNRTVAANSLFAVLSAAVGIAAAFGYRVELDSDTLQALAGGVAALVTVANAVVHVTTSERVGLPSAPSAGADRGDDRHRDGQPAPSPGILKSTD